MYISWSSKSVSSYLSKLQLIPGLLLSIGPRSSFCLTTSHVTLCVLCLRRQMNCVATVLVCGSDRTHWCYRSTW